MKFITADNAAREICIFRGDTQLVDYARVLRAVLRCVSELNLAVIPTFRTIICEIGQNYTVKLPDDVVNILRVGVIQPNGELLLFGENKKLRISTANQAALDDPCDPEDTSNPVVQNQTGIENTLGFFNVSKNGQYIGEFYGLKNRQFLAGVWRHNVVDGVIEFGSGHEVIQGAEVVIEYKSAMGDDGHRLVPEPFMVAIRYRVDQMLAPSGTGQSQAQYAQFVTEFNNAKRMLAKTDVKQLIAAIDEARYGAPKF